MKRQANGRALLLAAVAALVLVACSSGSEGDHAPAGERRISVFAGADEFTLDPIDGPLPQARFRSILDVDADAQGNLFVIDADAARKITPDGVVTTLHRVGNRYLGPAVPDEAGGILVDIPVQCSPHGCPFFGNVVRHVSAQGVVTGEIDTRQFHPLDLARDPAGALFWTTFMAQIMHFDLAGSLGVFAGTAEEPGRIDGVGRQARFECPSAIESDAGGNLYVLDRLALRRISPDAQVTTVGMLPPPGGPFGECGRRYDLAVDGASNVYVMDVERAEVWKITPSGDVSTLLTQAQLAVPVPQGVAVLGNDLYLGAGRVILRYPL
jgi:hypothetical protein